VETKSRTERNSGDRDMKILFKRKRREGFSERQRENKEKRGNVK
jgi:hypothetical protein